MEWEKPEVKSRGVNTTYEIPNSWLFIHYYEALNVLFRIENSLRVFVYAILKNTFYDDWTNIQIDISDDQKMAISAIAKKRIRQAQDYGYLGYEISSPLMHLNSGELVRMITSAEYWKYFSSYFKGRKEIIRNKLDEIASIRNSLAHFRPIKEDDVDLIKQNAKHALIGVESCLTEMTEIITIVPTNTHAEWYKKIITTGSDSCRLSLFQSKSGEWVKIQIIYRCKNIRKDSYSGKYISYEVLNIITQNIINIFPKLRKYLTYVSEGVPYVRMPDDFDLKLFKKISLVFRKQVLNDNINDIYPSLLELLDKITEEEELVANDHLAKGKIIEPARVSASLLENDGQSRWEIKEDSLKCLFQEDDPAEYWGDLEFSYIDFISKTSKYPWMPSDISNFAFPF